LFSVEASVVEINYGVPHLAACRDCWIEATEVVASLRDTKNLPRFSDSRDAVVTLMEAEEDRIARSLRSKGWWAGLKDATLGEQKEKINEVAAVQTGEVFETIIHQAQILARRDPFAAERSAMTAHLLVDKLSDIQFPPPVKNAFRLSAMTVVANSRRLAANWPGAFEAVSRARTYLTPQQMVSVEGANLISVHASLVCDTGLLEEAEILLYQAAGIYRGAGDFVGVAKIGVKEADAILASGRPEEALMKARDVLAIMPPGCARLEMFARNIATESLVGLGRLSEALRSYGRAKPLNEQFGGEVDLLKFEYLEAKILDALGDARESEKLFRSAIHGLTEAEIYRSAFIARLALFESLFKRAAFGKAARLCEEAIGLLQKTKRIHAQMSQVWKDLLVAVKTQALEEYHLSVMKDYLIRHWTSPATNAPVFTAKPKPD